MIKRVEWLRRNYTSVQTSSIRDLRTRLRHLDLLDKVVIVAFVLAIVASIYLTLLRHP